MLYRAGVDTLKAMKIVGHSEYQTTANIYTHLDREMMQATAEDLADVFKKMTTETRKGKWRQASSKVIRLPRTGT